MRKTVVILQHKLLHYRVPFFEVLKEKAQNENLEIILIHGQPAKIDLCRKDTETLSWSKYVKNKYFQLGSIKLLWQPFPLKFKDVDLLVIMQENKIISNYLLIAAFRLLKKRIAYWGHGKNFQSQNPTGLFERFKKILVCSVHWWFTYTRTSVDVIRNAGFDPNRITCLNNSIDTNKFRDEMESITGEEIHQVKKSLSIPEDAFVGLFCSSLYPEKKIDFLLKSCEQVKKRIDTFCMIVIGDGPLSPLVREFSDKNSWFHYAGAQKGRHKALFFKIADIVLNPGLLGLHILDAFCAGLPIISLNTSLHSPEISYLKNSENGFLVDEDEAQYASKVSELFNDKKWLERISKNAYDSSFKYSVETMADNFLDGIKKNLR